MAKYPFLAEAGKYLKDKGFTLDQFGIRSRIFMPIVEKAYHRIEICGYRTKFTIQNSTNPSEKETTLPCGTYFRFLIAVILLLKLCGLEYIDQHVSHLLKQA